MQSIEFGWPYIFWPQFMTNIQSLWPWFRAMASTVVGAKSSTWPIEFTCWSGQIFQFNGRCGIYFYSGEKWVHTDFGRGKSKTHFMWLIQWMTHLNWLYLLKVYCVMGCILSNTNILQSFMWLTHQKLFISCCEVMTCVFINFLKNLWFSMNIDR